jgi:HEAT repeat protein
MIAVALYFLSFLADRPQIVNGRLEALGAPSSLSRDFQALSRSAREATWVGYSAPGIAGSHFSCGFADVVHLDGSGRSRGGDHDRPAGDLVVFYRLRDGRVTEIVPVSSRCRIDAGGNTVRFWDSVTTSESLSLLETLEPQDEVLHAIALHADPRADELLDRLAGEGSPHDVRETAVFWLGSARGEEGFRRLAARFDSEKDPELREHVVFAIHLSESPGAIPKLIEIARRDRDADVRERALFWLAQKAGRQAARAIADAVNDDPEVEVKKKAVFALSQLPEDEGVPLLIEVAESHRNPEVRKAAYFWLGQRDDPRAIALFERVLLGRR